MIKIFDYIDKLDESGNYRLADKLENEVRKIYAQAIQQTPGMQPNHMLNPNFAFILNQLLLKEQAKMTKKQDTDTLSPTKNPDLATIQKKINDLTSKFLPVPNQIKKLNQNYDMIPNLASMIGNQTEKIDEESSSITKNSNDIYKNTEDITMLENSIQTLK
jgi:hypothetical protein